MEQKTKLRLVVVNRAGKERTFETAPRGSLMEALRNGGFDELEGLCGGCRSCATCHVHVAADYLDRLPAMEEEEKDLLDGSLDRNELSRLSCQIPLTDALDGLRIVIAKAD